ncbi:MAG: hypothetical protein J0L77_08715 [Alphaproteobacteria bacterium]|nr:hypothetical protein [Alphaproteobacteria bacterium]
MFTECDFLLGENHGVTIVVPVKLPPAETYTVSISPRDVKFRAGHEPIAHFSFRCAEVFKRLSDASQVGVVECPAGEPFPDCITALAYVELRGDHS